MAGVLISGSSTVNALGATTINREVAVEVTKEVTKDMVLGGLSDHVVSSGVDFAQKKFGFNNTTALLFEIGAGLATDKVINGPISKTIEVESGKLKGVDIDQRVPEISGGESGSNSVDNIIKGVENGDIPLTNNIQKGNYGEMKMDSYFESQGYKRISLDRVTDIDAPTHQGIDGVYYNPDGHPPYIIGEAKYGSSNLSKLVDRTPQMSLEWIEGEKGTPRLELSVGKDVADDILIEGYDSVLVKIKSDGNVITYMLDENGKTIK